jgi:hypothetical protein
VDFGGGPLTSPGFWSDIFVGKYNASGTHIWSQRFGDVLQDGGIAIAVDGIGNALVTGWFSHIVYFGGAPLSSVLESHDIFIAKFGELLSVQLDIKPGSCPNPLNVKPFVDPPVNAKPKKGGVLPVAVLGTGEFDVSDIEVSTLLLNGVASLRYGFEDVAAPV